MPHFYCLFFLSPEALFEACLLNHSVHGTFLIMSSAILNLPFRAIFILGNRKETGGDRSGEWREAVGGTGFKCFAKNSQCCVSLCVVFLEIPSSCSPHFWFFCAAFHTSPELQIIHLINHLFCWNKLMSNSGAIKKDRSFYFQVCLSCLLGAC